MSNISYPQLVKNIADAYRTASRTTEKVKYGELASKVEQMSTDKLKNAYDGIIKIADYFYDSRYSELDYDNAYSYFEKEVPEINQGACSAVRNGNFFGGNFDMTYSESASVVVRTPHTETLNSTFGISSLLSKITPELIDSQEYDELFAILPFVVDIGINEHGVVVKMNVVPLQKGKTTGTVPEVSKEVTLCSLMLPRYILDHFSTAQSAVEYLRDHAEIFTAKSMHDKDFEQHFIIADLTNTYIIEFSENAMQIITDKSYMTNFYLYDVTLNADGKVNTPATSLEGHYASDNGITTHGSGLERFNLIVDNYQSANTAVGMRELMNKLMYTQTYLSASEELSDFWYTEYVGGNLTVDSAPTNFTNIINEYDTVFQNRSRDPESEYFGTWQTMYSCVFDIERKILNVVVQEAKENGTFVEHQIKFDNYESPTETIEITENGEYDVTEYATASVNVDSGAQLNIAYGDTAPEDTSKLWIKTEQPSNIEFGYNLENGVESIQTLLTELPNAAAGIASAVIGTKVYLFGGTGNTQLNTINVFDTETNNITTLSTTLPVRVNNCASAVIGTKVYLFGGYDTSNSNRIRVFDTETNNITTLSTTLPNAASSIASAVIGTKVYLFGGVGNTRLNTINVFDTETNNITTLLTTLPNAAASIASAVIGTKVYLFGGYGYSARLNTINVFDTETNNITTLSTTLPNAASSIASAVIGTKVYLFGGYGTSNSNRIRVFDTETNNITTLLTTLPNAAEMIASGVVGTKVYLFGGRNPNASEYIYWKTINKFTVTFPLSNGNIFVQEGFFKNRFDIVPAPTKVNIGVSAVYKGNEDNEAELAEAYLYNEDTEQWELI